MRHDQHNHIDQILDSVHRPEKHNQYLQSIDPLILKSWQRCVHNYNLEPSPTRGARVLTQQELQDHRLPVEDFLHIAKSALHELHKQVNPLDYVILLTDKNGITVDYIGNKKYDAELRQFSLYLGSDWNEQYAGTCGVGVCATEMLPVTAHHNDHFDLKNTSLTCSAAPVFDPEGQPLAVLDVSALSSPKNKESQFLMLQLVKVHAQAIESANFVHHFQKKHWILRFGPLQDYVNINAQNMIAIDEAGKIVGLNTAARKYLTNVQTWTDQQWDMAIGKNVTEFLQCELDDIINHTSGSGRCIKSVSLAKTGEQIFYSTSAPLNYQFMYFPTEKCATTSSIASQKTSFSLDDLACGDPAMQKAVKLAKRLVNSRINFLIQGETGSGKEVFARAIHYESERSGQPFVAVNCAAIPESLIESELFGYKPGTFTGARNKGMRGLIQQSSGGTLFLDEIGDMPLHLQTRLLRVLSEQEVMPLGSDKAIPVDLNVIAATHQHIDSMIVESNFREDLYFRLAGVTLILPSLRDRQDKEQIIKNALWIESDRQKTEIASDALELLMAYNWPGNIRELRNTLRVAYAFCDREIIVADDLPDDFLYKLNKSHGEEPRARFEQQASPTSAEIASDSCLEALANSLKKNRWNITETASELGISRATIYRKMKKYKIIPPNNMGF